ncbi:MAG: hypothetical protein J6386_22320 [Candidatus Synoicihabitans palmerolidicus]|nr:hypothetical protein [Candidatus Synoicihabitans palmerolidicus]
MNELEQVTKLCERLGAESDRAEAMARQLLKRAEQISAERGCSRVEAMEYLLELTTKGASGVTPPGFEGGTPPGDTK